MQFLTDRNGAAFYEQALYYMELKYGLAYVKQFMGLTGEWEEYVLQGEKQEKEKREILEEVNGAVDMEEIAATEDEDTQKEAEHTVDVLEDLRTALDESFDLLLHQDYCAETITLCCEARSDGLHVSLTAQERTEQPCPDAADADIAQLIIGTLVREVNLEQDAQGVHCVRMTLPARG